MGDYRDRPPVDAPRTINVNPYKLAGFAICAASAILMLYVCAVAVGRA